jgi:cyclic pyranopterin phosphate synthase
MKTVQTKKSLIDYQNRAIKYLRVSLTQRCNMKCSYCFGSLEKRRTSFELSNADIIRLIEAFASMGINKIRFTGGEPLLRHGIIDLMARTKEIDGIEHIGLTTNGLLLEPLLPGLLAAGLNSVNISLDSLRPDTFFAIAKMNGLDRVMAAIDAALQSGAFPLAKINTVVMRGINDGELSQMALWALERKLDIRFIEFMPTGKSDWSCLFVSEAEIRQRIGLDLEKCKSENASPGPAVSYRYKNYPGRISFISAVSRSFCGSCNRLRLTSRGEIFGCLFREQRADLKNLLDRGGTTDEIAGHIADLIARPNFRREPGDVSITDYKPFMQAVGG